MSAVAIVSETTNPSAISIFISPLGLGTYLCAIPLSKFEFYSTFILQCTVTMLEACWLVWP